MLDKMKKPCFENISLTDTLKIWSRAVIYTLVVIFRRIFVKLWKKPAVFSQLDKPPSCLLESIWGNHMFVKVKGVKFHYVQSGERSKLPLVLLLHGFPDCWLGWRHQIKALSKYFRVIALDLKGFGDSEKPQWRIQYSVEILLRELREVVRAQGTKRCIVIGHDVGAALGWYFTAQHPVLVTKFVSISNAHPNIHWNQLLNDAAFNSKFIDFCQMPMLPETEIRKGNLAMIDMMFQHLGKCGESNILEAYKYVFSRTEDVTGPLHYLRNLPLHRLKETKLKVPTLLLIGTKDPYLLTEALVRSSEFLVTYDIKLVEGAGHFPHQEKPDIVNQLLLSFLLGARAEKTTKISETSRSSLIGSLMSSTFKYGNSLVDNVVKSTNGVVWKPNQTA